MISLKKILKQIIYSLNKNPLSQFLYKQEIAKRSKLKLSDIVPLSKKINLFSPFTPELHPPNDWYGHAKILKQFLSLPQNYQFKFILEHGIYLTEQVADADLETDLPTIITYCDYRAKILKKYRQNVFSIGPFIHYANSFLSDSDVKKEKARLGKSILVFPSHSTAEINFDFNRKWFLKQVQKISKKFDTIRICLYWVDVLRDGYKFYQNLGYECVTAGHILDPLFLPRLKSLMMVSDLTIANDASTTSGYSVYMSKPHIIFHQQAKISGSRNEVSLVKDFWQSEPYIKVLEEFSKVSFKITPRQRNLVNTYWGLDQIKTKKELKSIVEKTEKIFSNKTQ